MPKSLCVCNTVLNYSEIPNSIEWLLISDVEYDKFQGEVDAEQIYSHFTHMLKCPVCQRIHIFWQGFDSPPTTYTLDKPFLAEKKTEN